MIQVQHVVSRRLSKQHRDAYGGDRLPLVDVHTAESESEAEAFILGELQTQTDFEYTTRKIWAAIGEEPIAKTRSRWSVWPANS